MGEDYQNLYSTDIIFPSGNESGQTIYIYFFPLGPHLWHM